MSKTPVLVAKLQSAIINGDFEGGEATGIVFRQFVRAATTELTYQWIIENDEAVIDLVSERRRSRTVPAFGGAFCSIERAEDWNAFIVSHAEKLPGYERALAQTTESIRLCAALKQAKADELVAAFSEHSSQQ